MYPDLTSLTNDANVNRALEYLGQINPEDTPAENPLLKIWTTYNMPPYILKPFVQPGVNFEKVTFEFKIAKHKLEQLDVAPSIFDTIEYPITQKEQY